MIRLYDSCIVKRPMLFPDLSKLALSVEVKCKECEYEGDNGDKPPPAFDIDPTQPLPYRSLGPPTKRANLTAPIVVHNVRMMPRPGDALLPYDIWKLTLEAFGAFLLAGDETVTTELFEERLEGWVRNALSIKVEMTYNAMLMFLGYYIALSIMAINASGPPDAPWGGPITYPDLYPVARSIEIWNEIQASGQHTAVKNVLNRVCSGEPNHPWYNVDSKSRRMGAYPFIDTMGGIMNMTNPTEGNFYRELLIASRDGEFMGHVFVSYAISPIEGIKGLMPYGIQRSAFYLPGTCAPPKDAGGFVDALFDHIGKIARENEVTHIFTWPLKKMKARFLAMGYELVPKNNRANPLYTPLYYAVVSIYGVGSALTNLILGREFIEWDFVLRRL